MDNERAGMNKYINLAIYLPNQINQSFPSDTAPPPPPPFRIPSKKTPCFAIGVFWSNFRKLQIVFDSKFKTQTKTQLGKAELCVCVW